MQVSDDAQGRLPTIGNGVFRREVVIFTSFLLLVFLLRLPYLRIPFENDSGAYAYHARLILEGFPLYGVHHPAHHMPAAYYLYALAFALFGQSPFAVKLFLVGWLAITVYLIYRLGVRVAGRATGLLAALFAAILFAHVGISAQSSRRELFVALPQVAAVLILFYSLSGRRRRRLFFVGLFSAGAFLLKATYLSPLALAFVALASDLWAERREPRAWRTFLLRGCWIAAGFIAAIIPVVLYFAGQGLLDRFLMVFTIGRRYLSVRQHPFLTGPQYIVLYPLAVLALNNALMLILALTAFLFIAWKAIRRLRQRQERGGRFWMGYIALWFILVLITTNVSRSFLHHYYLVLIPSFSLLVAWLLRRIYDDLLHTGGRYRPHLATAVLGAAVGLILLLSAISNFRVYQHYLQYATGAATYREFLLEGLPDDAGVVAEEMSDVADYVSANSEPDDRLYYWGNFMELYWLAERQSVIDMIWPRTVTVGGPRERIFQADYIVVGTYTIVGLEPMPEWLVQGLDEYYELEAVIHGRQIYRQDTVPPSSQDAVRGRADRSALYTLPVRAVTRGRSSVAAPGVP